MSDESIENDIELPAKKRWPWWKKIAVTLLFFTLGVSAFWHFFVHPTLERMGCFNSLYYGPYQTGRLYAQREENNGLWPPLSTVPGKFFYRWEDRDEELGGFADCPASPAFHPYDSSAKSEEDALFWDDYDYLYFGYFIRNDDEAKAFLKMYPERIDNGLGFEEDIEVELDNGKTVMLFRLREYERALADGIKVSKDADYIDFIAIIERPRNHGRHPQNGMKVHANFVSKRYDGPLVQDWFWDELEAIEARYETE